jgi:hypothetical protein
MTTLNESALQAAAAAIAEAGNGYTISLYNMVNGVATEYTVTLSDGLYPVSFTSQSAASEYVERERNLAKAKAAVEAYLAAADGWMPIETAPKNGIKIDVGVLSQWGFERHCDIWWSAKRDSWVFWGDNGFERYGEVRISFDPTHWRPLPAPPSIRSDDREGGV